MTTLSGAKKMPCNFYLPPDVWEMRNVRKARKGKGEGE